METALVDLFKHNLWANQRLLNTCANLSDEQLDASAPGTYGRVRDTLAHITAAEGWYVSLLVGSKAEQPWLSAEFPGFEELRARLTRSG